MEFDELVAWLVKEHGLSHDQIKKLTPYQVRRHYGRRDNSSSKEQRTLIQKLSQAMG